MNRYRKWAVLGRIAAIERSTSTKVSKLAFEADLATRLGLTPATLRNYADAVRLVRALPDPGVRAALFRSSAVAAAVAARWYRRNPISFMSYFDLNLHDTPPRIVNDRGLLKADREDKATAAKSPSHRMAPNDPVTMIKMVVQPGRWRLRPELARHIPELTAAMKASAPKLLVPDDPLSRFLGLSRVLVLTGPAGDGTERFWTATGNGLSPAIAFIEISDRVVLERYRTEARNIWLRALATSLYVKLAVLVLPSSAARRHMLSQVPDEGIKWLSHPGKGANPINPADHRGRSRPILARLTDHRANIMVSTRRSLLCDLFD